MLAALSERDKRSIDFDAIRIQLASPDTIRQWSYGEVTKPETINYRTFKPEKDGLFCERIFGPVKDWECNCGKYKRIRHRGVVCDRCGVEVTQAKVRRERLGHIELAVPVSHIWYFKSIPSRIGHLLDMSMRDLERVLYYESYVVLDPGVAPIQKRDLLSEDRYQELNEEFPGGFKAEMGAGAIRKLLAEIELEELSAELRAHIKVETSVQRKKDMLKRLKVVENFRASGNRPEWMILDVIPVLPPDLRPLVPLEGGRFATSDLNDLYRRVINRNNRLKKLVEIKAPEVILRNEKRMLQEAVDALFDNGRRSRAIRGPGNRPLKSLSDMLKGKQGRFRQNLLGKRVDYSGRSVIVVGPELDLHQCGLPKSMALELFKPFIIRQLEDRGYVQTVKSAKKLVEREKPEVWDILEDIIRDHPVLLNRAPTLHRLGIQAFQPVLVEGKAIRIHPLVCQAFNADFDGDQMAVHVPLSFEAQLEARLLMMSSDNILSPAHGRPLASPTQDLVLGCHYLSKEKKGARGEGMSFATADQALACYAQGVMDLHALIRVRRDDGYVVTTAGRLLLNRVVPPDLGVFMNEELNKKLLEELVGDIHRRLGAYRTAIFLDELKGLGFEYATRAGVTVGIDDIVVPDDKPRILERSEKEVQKISALYQKRAITDGERYNRVIDIWTKTTSEVGEVMFEGLSRDQQGFNPIFMMANSGARGSKEQIRQLAGMRGLMAKPQKKITGQIGEIIEAPIKSNFREGLNVLEYFISTHGARKGLADTALKTADAGYLTRRLVDVAQDAIVNEEDCGTIMGLEITALKEGEEIIEPLKDRILGRVAAEDIVHPVSGEVLVHAGEMLAEEASQAIDDSGLESVRIRSVLTCDARRGLCAKCYGRNLATGRMVAIGEAVGVIGAQSIGEPGTQLTLRTFHIGGTAGRIAEQSRIEAKVSGRVHYHGLSLVERGPEEYIAVNRGGEIRILDERERARTRYVVPIGAHVVATHGQEIAEGDPIFEWDPYTEKILTDKAGRIIFEDLIEEATFRQEIDGKTGRAEVVIIEHKDRKLHPHVYISDPAARTIGREKKDGKDVPVAYDENGRPIRHGILRDFPLPTRARIEVKDGEEVRAGTVVGKIPREISKTRDITGGLPRVAELFEARKPKDHSVVAEIEGAVKMSGVLRGLRRMLVVADNGEESEYLVPHGRHLRVTEGDRVRAGDRLTEGPINPHDILRISGINAVQEYLVNEIQEVYRLQGVRINDKHIEVIVRQMLQKVRVEDSGDTTFLEGEQLDKAMVREENERTIAEGGKPATTQPLLLGITKASLSTESFVSAASFQETTRVLTEAAIQGNRDWLRGLKENVIIGHLIPAGTGIERCRRIRIQTPEGEDAAAEAGAEEAEAGGQVAVGGEEVLGGLK